MATYSTSYPRRYPYGAMGAGVDYILNYDKYREDPYGIGNPYDIVNSNLDGRFHFDANGNLGMTTNYQQVVDEGAAPTYNYQTVGASHTPTSEASGAEGEAGGEGAGGGAPWGMIGSIAGGVFNSLPNWYGIQHDDESANAVKAIYGDSSEDPIARLITGNSGDMKVAKDEIRGNQVDYSGVKNNESLLNAWDSNDLQNGVNYKFGWSNVADNLTAFGKGASIGAQFGGGWGALIGGVIGGASNIISQLGGSDRAEELNREVQRANKMQVDSFYNTAQNNQARSQRRAMMNYFALGGNLDGLNGIEHFNVGGSHGENPNGGVQQGVAPDGQPNMVEEGEVKYKDYIYSKRIKPSKALLKKNNLPEKYAGLSYAEIADKLQQESEDRPNDPISIGTLDAWMERLQNAQEETRTTNSMRRAAKLIDGMSDEEKMGILAMMQGEEPPIMASGGKIHIKESKKGTFTAAAKWHELGGHLFATGGPDDYPYGDKYYPTGYGIDYIDGPVFPVTQINIPEGDTSLAEYIVPEVENPYDTPWRTSANVVTTPAPVVATTAPARETAAPRSTKGGSGSSTQGLNFGETDLRYAPAVGSFVGLLTSAIQGRDYTLANQLRQIASQYNPMAAPTLGGYRRYTPFDVNLGDAENLALQIAALRENRGHNRATRAALDNAIIHKFQETSAKRNLTAQEANEQRRAAIDAYNLGIDRENAALAQAYDRLNASIKDKRLSVLQSAATAQDASDTAWAKSLSETATNFFNQLGNVGKDAWSKNQALAYIKEHPELIQLLGLI